MPPNTGGLFRNFTVFHPIWGIFRPILGNLITLPLITSSPLQWPNSMDSLNSICRPRQMPRYGFPFFIELSTGASRFRLSRFFIQSRNAPTPGSTTAEASSMSRGLDVTFAATPTFRKAFSTLRRFPIP